MMENNMTSVKRRLLFAGSYAPASDAGIYGLGFDERAGTLTVLGTFAGIANPTFLVVHPNGRWLYAVGETGQRDVAPGSVWALNLTREPWAVQPINQQPSAGDWPCHLHLDATGKWLLVSNYGSGSAGVLPIRPDGSLGEMSDLVQHQGHGAHPERQAGPHAHSATLTPDQRFA